MSDSDWGWIVTGVLVYVFLEYWSRKRNRQDR
jgi:hypothetical protein